MAVINFFVDNGWYLAGIAAMIGVMLDFVFIRKGVKAAVLLPMVVGVMWLFGDSAQIAQKWSDEARQSQAQQVEK